MRKRILHSLFLGLCASILLNACQNGSEIKQAQYMVNGRGLYQQHCMNCHGDQGQGMGVLYPPLTDRDYLQKNKGDLATIIRNGLEGEIFICGIAYDGIMLPNYELTEVDIAYLLNYIGNSFGNDLGHISIASVKKDLGLRE